MADGVKVSRGNPRSSSVGEEEDVDEVRYRSTSALDSLDVVAIEDCGIPLDCGSSGDTFGPSDPCESLSITIYNVMGQEDRFRQEDGARIDRGGVGRAVITTDFATDIDLYLDRAPSDEDNPIFERVEQDISTGKRKHEFFFSVSPDALYAFKIEATSSQCPDISKQSGIYYFNTQDEVIFKFETEVKAEVSVTIKDISEFSLPVVDDFSGNADEISGSITRDLSSNQTNQNLGAVDHSTQILFDNFDTRYTTS